MKRHIVHDNNGVLYQIRLGVTEDQSILVLRVLSLKRFLKVFEWLLVRSNESNNWSSHRKDLQLGGGGLDCFNNDDATFKMINSNLSFDSILKIQAISICSKILRNSGTYCQTFKPFQQLHVSMSWVVPEHTVEFTNRFDMFQLPPEFRNILSNLRTVPTLFSYIRPWEFPMSLGVPERTLYVSERSLLY